MIQQARHVRGPARAAAAAGTYYPSNPHELRAAVAAMMRDAAMRQARGELQPGTPKAAIAPHAALPYAGPIAASVYARLTDLHTTIQRVVLIGPSHHVPVGELATCSADAFDTPLGSVPVDRDAVDALNELPEVVPDDRAHAREYALEVHLPFLIHALGSPRAERGANSGFAIVPLLVGEAADMQVVHALDGVWGGRETLVVVSSDLSRHEGYPAARRHDRQTANHILQGHIESVTAHDACGHRAIRGLMHLAWAHRLHPRLVDLRNSGDTAGPRDRVVGYGGFIYC